MPSVFMSYSHRDEAVRDLLEVHLAALKRQGVIEAWHDRRIVAGDEFDRAISERLDRADIILLLVSPFFIASGYCFEIELKRAMERHEAGEARVIPVIVDPCDWQSTCLAKLLAVPKDGRPISKYPNQHDAFLEVTQAIRSAVGQQPAKPVVVVEPAKASAGHRADEPPRSSNLRLKKVFTDEDRDTFLDESFAYTAKFFEQSLAELQNRNPGITGRVRPVSATHFAVEIYRHGKKVAKCGIRLTSGFGTRQIAYCQDPDSTNAMNAAVGVADDGYTLFLKAGFFLTGGDERGQLTPQGASEAFWGMLIGPLQG